MFLSMATIILIVTLFNICTLLLWIFLRNQRRIVKLDIGLLVASIVILLVRMFIPFEFFFQLTILDTRFLPILYKFLYYPILELNTSQLFMHHLLSFIWIVGIVVKGTAMVVQYIKFKGFVKSNNLKVDKKATDILTNINQEFGKHKDIKVFKTSITSVPMIFGIFNPTILLPNMNFTDEELYYVLKHEATHHYRHDLLIKLVAEMGVIIYWWNPLTIILKKEMNKLLEINVDRKLVEPMSEREKVHYLECLLKVAKEGTSKEFRSFSLALDSQSTSVLYQRFNAVLESKGAETSRYKTGLLSTGVLVLSLISFWIVIEPYSIDPAVEESTVEITPGTAFLVNNNKGTIDIYVDNQYFATIDEIPDVFSELILYSNLEEVSNYEND